MNAYLVEVKKRRIVDSEMCEGVSWKWHRQGTYLVAADNPVQAAEFMIARMVETKTMPKNYGDVAIYVCEYKWDGKPGFKTAANTNGDIRYDVRRSADGYWPEHSEKSFA